MLRILQVVTTTVIAFQVLATFQDNIPKSSCFPTPLFPKPHPQAFHAQTKFRQLRYTVIGRMNSRQLKKKGYFWGFWKNKFVSYFLLFPINNNKKIGWLILALKFDAPSPFTTYKAAFRASDIHDYIGSGLSSSSATQVEKAWVLWLLHRLPTRTYILFGFSSRRFRCVPSSQAAGGFAKQFWLV